MNRLCLSLFTMVSTMVFADDARSLVPDGFEKAQLEPLISAEMIQSKIKEVCRQLEADYAGEEVVVVLVMKGAISIGADLIRELNLPCTIEFCQASSYGQLGVQRGDLTLSNVDSLAISGKHVLLVDDIFDSGATLSSIVDRLSDKNPRTIKTLVLLLKNAHKVTSYRPDYALFNIEDEFVIGYGLDYKEYFRGLDGVYIYKPEGSE